MCLCRYGASSSLAAASGDSVIHVAACHPDPIYLRAIVMAQDKKKRKGSKGKKVRISSGPKPGGEEDSAAFEHHIDAQVMSWQCRCVI